LRGGRQRDKTAEDFSTVAFSLRAEEHVAGPALNVQRTNDRVSDMIELYRGNECLWSRQQPDYKTRNKKADAWNSIVEEVRIPRNIVAKMYSIRSVYAREEGDSKCYEVDEVYVPAWFAYQHLLFLLDNLDPGVSSDTLRQDNI
jgi:hypothetical protein